MEWHVGQRVRNLPEKAHVYEGTGWLEKMSKFRLGTIIELPAAIREHPESEGTMLVHWDSLTGDNSNQEKWQCWVHSTFVRPA